MSLGEPSDISRHVEGAQAEVSSLSPGSVGSEEQDRVWTLQERLYVDGISRVSHGVEYDEVIWEIAEDKMRAHIVSQNQSRAARFAGFSTFESMATRLEQLEAEDSPAAATLGRLIEESIRLSGSVEDYSMRAWGNPTHLDVYDPETDSDRSAWKGGRDLGEHGLYRCVSSTRIGDRRFDLHFDSMFFPSLDIELATLVDLKESFWSVVPSK